MPSSEVAGRDLGGTTGTPVNKNNNIDLFSSSSSSLHLTSRPTMGRATQLFFLVLVALGAYYYNKYAPHIRNRYIVYLLFDKGSLDLIPQV